MHGSFYVLVLASVVCSVLFFELSRMKRQRCVTHMLFPLHLVNVVNEVYNLASVPNSGAITMQLVTWRCTTYDPRGAEA